MERSRGTPAGVDLSLGHRDRRVNAASRDWLEAIENLFAMASPLPHVRACSRQRTRPIMFTFENRRLRGARGWSPAGSGQKHETLAHSRLNHSTSLLIFAAFRRLPAGRVGLSSTRWASS